ncbi:MAG TPA: YbhB/YbcL family Raf kinase inhibitor-like protein [Nocardioidaceae bacterium]
MAELRAVVLVFAVAAVSTVSTVSTLSACSGGGASDTPEPTTEQQSITVTSKAFSDGDLIPETFSCDGENVSPPLDWDGVPGAAQSLALVVADPDAPGGTYYHWLVTDIPVDITNIGQDSEPDGGVVADNSAGDAAYTGPCPPSGTHHYRFTIYALSKPTGLPPGSGVDETVDAIGTRAIASGTLVGTYTRH